MDWTVKLVTSIAYLSSLSLIQIANVILEVKLQRSCVLPDYLSNLNTRLFSRRKEYSKIIG